MGSLGAPEILVILVVALLVLGPDRLPDAARQVGRAIAEMRRISSGFQAELRDAIQTPTAGPAVPPAPSSTVTPAPPPSDQKYLWSDLPSGDETAP
jgi:Tat protein translocase TatB subunit